MNKSQAIEKKTISARLLKTPNARSWRAADVAGEKKSGKASKRLAAALESGPPSIGRVREKAVKAQKSGTQDGAREPYQAIAIAIGVGRSSASRLRAHCSKKRLIHMATDRNQQLERRDASPKHFARQLLVIAEKRLER